MSKALVLITGANSGLGYYAAQQLAASGNYHVLLGSRDAAKGAAAVASLLADTSHPVSAADLEALTLDVTSDASLAAAAQTVAQNHGRLDALLSNAGISHLPTADTLASLPLLRESLRTHYETNVFGATLVVEAFLPLLRQSSHPLGRRIAFTSSGLSSLAWAAEQEGLYSAAHGHVYRSSKTALNMLMLYYARTLEADGFVVSASDPGYCATSLNDHRGVKDPREGARVVVRAATAAKADVHARVVDENAAEPW